MVNPNYLKDIQTEITSKQRATLINWLVEVHYKFRLLPETLFVAVNIIDMFLAKELITSR